MEYKTKKEENAAIRITVKNSPDEVEEAYQKAYNRAGQKLKVKGFRQGKVPREIAEKHLGDSVADDAARGLIAETFKSIAPDLDPPPISMPSFEVESFDRARGAVFTGLYDTHPEVKLGKYKKIKVKQDRAEIADSQTDDELQRLRKEHTTLRTREEDEVSIQGDRIAIEMTVREGDAVLFEKRPLEIEIGSEENVPGMNEALLGLKIGESKKFNSIFPEDFPDPAFKSKNLDIDAHVVTIQEQQLPDLDDDFAGEIGEYKTIEDLRKAIYTELEKHASSVLKKRTQESLLGEIAKDCKFTIPNVLVQEEIKRRLEALQTRFTLESSDLATLAHHMGRKPEELEPEFREASIRTIQADLALMEIARKEGLKVSDTELKEEVQKKFSGMMSADKLEDWMKRDDFISNVRSSILYRNTLDWVYEHADIKDGNTLSYADLMQARDFQ